MSSNDLSQTIGRRVRAARNRIGMTRKQLAATADVSERYLSALECGEANASIGILVKVGEAIGIDVATLVAAGDGVGLPGRAAKSGPGLAELLADMSHAEQSGALDVLAHYLHERRRAAKGVALLGLRGAGKSTLGRLLAERHGLAFVSVTREIEQRAGMSVADLFNLGGPDAYRSLEVDVLSEIARRAGLMVVETAGGIVGNRQALDITLAAFKTVWLKASPDEHLYRVATQGDTRPMHGNPKALEHISALLTLREPEYARAELVLDTTGRSTADCLSELERMSAPILAAQTA